MKRYEVWYGDEYLGIFYEDELAYIAEEIPGYSAVPLDD